MATTDNKKVPSSKLWKQSAPFVLGGASGMIATTCIQPIDMIKVRIQLMGEGGKKVNANPFSVASKFIREEGFFKLYSGLSAGLLRQATYTTARMGIFRTISDAMVVPGKPTPLWKKTFAGLAAGGLGSIFGTPADVALIRMQSDATLPVAQRRNYTGVANALIRITKEEGMSGMFKGCGPVVARAMALNVGMLTGYDQALETLNKFSSNKDITQPTAKVISGFLASAFSLPFDFVKTRVQKQTKRPDGTFPYKSFVDCCRVVMKEEGPMAFYKGFWTYYIRIAPHVMITLFALDVLQKTFPVVQ